MSGGDARLAQVFEHSSGVRSGSDASRAQRSPRPLGCRSFMPGKHSPRLPPPRPSSSSGRPAHRSRPPAPHDREPDTSGDQSHHRPPVRAPPSYPCTPALGCWRSGGSSCFLNPEAELVTSPIGTPVSLAMADRSWLVARRSAEILVYGSRRLSQTLIGMGLVDELQIQGCTTSTKPATVKIFTLGFAAGCGLSIVQTPRWRSGGSCSADESTPRSGEAVKRLATVTTWTGSTSRT